MRKTKVITALSLTVILAMMAMPAVVSAVEMDVKPDGIIDLVPGSDVLTTLYLSEMRCDGSDRTLDVAVKKGTPGDLTFKVTDLTGSGTAVPTLEGIAYTYTPDAGTETYNIQVEIKAATGTEGNGYTIFYKDVQSGISDKASASVRATSIPEFTTIAVPIATILGLLFFFNYRKQKAGRGNRNKEVKKRYVNR